MNKKNMAMLIAIAMIFSLFTGINFGTGKAQAEDTDLSGIIAASECAIKVSGKTNSDVAKEWNEEYSEYKETAEKETEAVSKAAFTITGSDDSSTTNEFHYYIDEMNDDAYKVKDLNELKSLDGSTAAHWIEYSNQKITLSDYAGKQIVPKIVISENKSAGTDTKSGTDGAKGIQQSAPDNDTGLEGDKLALYNAVLNGLKNEGADCTAKLLENTDSMEVVNEVLIPALDKIGEEFEKGTLFLPQLIMSASVAQAAFEVIRKFMIKSDAAPVSKGKIVIATVKGDVHDIGKNIVKVLLENYGYDVLDLGKDVPYQAVVDAVKENDVKLVGLSALMTTTLVSMKETIELLHENNLDCKVMVGGAVLTPEYAKEIHADFYAKDAKESVDIAKRVLG